MTPAELDALEAAARADENDVSDYRDGSLPLVAPEAILRLVATVRAQNVLIDVLKSDVTTLQAVTAEQQAEIARLRAVTAAGAQTAKNRLAEIERLRAQLLLQSLPDFTEPAMAVPTEQK